MTAVEVTWDRLLADVDRFQRELPHVFFRCCPTRGCEPCLVVDEAEFELDEDVPAEARRRGFTLSLLADDVFQVMENLRQQDPHADRDVLLRAIAHYFEWDAFIELSGDEAGSGSTSVIGDNPSRLLDERGAWCLPVAWVAIGCDWLKVQKWGG